MQARQVLEEMRGTLNVLPEFEDMQQHADIARKQLERSWLLILQRQHRPQLVLSALCPFFQLWTGVNILTFFAVEVGTCLKQICCDMREHMRICVCSLLCMSSKVCTRLWAMGRICLQPL